MRGADALVDFRVNFILPMEFDEPFEGISPTRRKKWAGGFTSENSRFLWLRHRR